MFHHSAKSATVLRQPRCLRRAGFTLAELLAVTVVMALVAMAMTALASAVQMSSQHQQGQSTAIHHGRVALERIERSVRTATANAQFPGFFVFSYSAGGYTYPDTLVVWQPADGVPADPDGMPKMNELVVFKADMEQPGQLLEMRVDGDAREAPLLSDHNAWAMELEFLQQNPSAQQTVLTNLVRVAAATGASGTSYGDRGCIRFGVKLHPSASEWTEYQSGVRTWESLSWPQDLYGSTSGTRQVWCRIELQLRPSDIDTHDAAIAIPLLGSGSL